MSFLLLLAVILHASAADPAIRPEPKPAEKAAAVWKPLFDGFTLNGWKEAGFATQGAVSVERAFQGGPGAIVIDQTDSLNGITYTNAVPKMNFEIALEAMKVDGSDFFCGLTFPVGESHCSLIVGGWGGAVVGISNIDGNDASENETTQFMKFEPGKWHRLRVRVTPAKIEGWLDEQKIADVTTTGHKIELRPGEIDRCVPLGLATYQTKAALRDIRLRTLKD